jgi:hypothetical protein
VTAHLPQTNATLTCIGRVKQTENYTEPEGEPLEIWGGEVDAYVIRRIVSGLNEAGELNRRQKVDIIIPSDLEPPITIEGGDTIEFKQWEPVLTEFRTYSAHAQTFETPMDLPSLPNYVKVALEDVSALD